MTRSDPIRVALGFPPFHAERFRERIDALEGVEAHVLPIDPDVNWGEFIAEHPYPEPPPFAESVAAERERVLSTCEVLT